MKAGFSSGRFSPTANSFAISLQVSIGVGEKRRVESENFAAGRWLRASAPGVPMRRLLVAGEMGIAAGMELHFVKI